LRSASCFYATPVIYLYLDRSQKWLDAHRVEQKKQMAAE
jgi:hypothetical protein